MNLNKAFILGNVTRDPESRAMPSGQQVVNFGLATNRFYTDQQGQKKQDTEFHNVVAFGKLADTISRYVTKGTLLLVEGRIRTSSWQGNDGVKKYRTEIIAENMQLGPRGAGGSGPMANSRPAAAPQPTEAKTDDIPIIEENQMPPAQFVSEDLPKDGEIDVSEIPF